MGGNRVWGVHDDRGRCLGRWYRFYLAPDAMGASDAGWPRPSLDGSFRATVERRPVTHVITAACWVHMAGRSIAP